MVCETCGMPAQMRQLGNEVAPICDTCWGRLEVQDELDREILRIAHSGSQDPEIALRAWSEFYSKHAHRDRDGWLRVSVCRQRAAVLLRAKQYVDAERELREAMNRAESGAKTCVVPDLAEFYALALEGTGRTADALRGLEDILAGSSERHPDEVLGTLLHYAQICRAHGMEMPGRLANQIGSAIEGLGLPVPEDVTRTSLVEATLLAHRLRMEAQERYVAMIEEASTVLPELRADVVQKYVDREVVGYFKELAMHSLE